MKRLIYIFTLTLILVSCGSRSGYFGFEGRLLNLNQGEFYVYSTDGVFDGVDTIKVEGGRFTFETPCRESGTLVIIFPNFSEQPVFAEPGKSVTIKGDASHLKEIEIEGTDENKLMNGFRQQIAKASPPEVTKYAAQFIKNNPQSLASVYVLSKYFITAPDADMEQAARLAQAIRKAQPKNGNVARILRYLTRKSGAQSAAGYRSSRLRTYTAITSRMPTCAVRCRWSIRGLTGITTVGTCVTDSSNCKRNTATSSPY